MKNKFDRSLSSAFSQMLPDDMYDRIKQNVVSAQERTEVISMEKTKRTKVRWIGAAVAACLLLAAGIFSGVYYTNNLAVDSVVNIDVNPSVEIATNKHDRVVKVTAVNEDAEKLLDGMNLKNTDLKAAVNAIIGAMAQSGYLADGEGGILVTVHNNDAGRAQQIRNQVLVDLDDSLKSNHVTASVLNQTVSDDTGARAFAGENGISVGKALFVQNLAQKDGMPDAAALAQMSLKEISALVVEKEIDISDIVDYDLDDSVWENIADHIEDIDEDLQENSAQAQVKLSAAEAKQLALQHSGIDPSKAVFVKVELDDDDGALVYEVEFCVDRTEYDYEIDAQDGTVRSSKIESDDDDRGGSNDTAVSAAASTSVITAEKAKEIALQHAGVTASDAVFEKTELDNDDGRAVYEVEFRSGSMEYDYEIDAEKGTVLEYKKETAD